LLGRKGAKGGRRGVWKTVFFCLEKGRSFARKKRERGNTNDVASRGPRGEKENIGKWREKRKNLCDKKNRLTAEADLTSKKRD